MDLRILEFWRKLLTLMGVALFAMALDQGSLWAQGRGGGRRGGGGGADFSGDGFFRMLDRNNNGQIDPDEVANSPIRRMLENSGRDLSKPISRQDFEELSRSLREQGRQGFMGRGDAGSGNSGGGVRVRSSGKQGRGRDNDNGADAADERNGSSSGGNSTPTQPAPGGGGSRSASGANSGAAGAKRSSMPNPKKGNRMWLELPESYRDRDKDGDNQIGMYEWPRGDYATFIKLDTNGDGYLTPQELERGPRASGSTGSGAVASTRRPGPSSDGRSGDSSTGESEGSNSAYPTGPAPAINPVSPAETAFSLLDRNKDAIISAEEWERSISVRGLFERAGVTVTLPMSKDEFLKVYPNK